ncbi:putative glucosylceramidase 3 [Diorhabda carinulata]|uniref:putative glucosylceramidase 3 n=1 Tax=Diorhabda carinulata TaxID=1163345 RepID=UPI0025A08139|nr:putative glucosylceramidase 3 [Diorhabda carinulata]
MKLVLILILLIACSGCKADGCLERDYGEGNTVCVCNNQHCDTMPRINKVSFPYILIYTSNKSGKRFKKNYKTFTTRGGIKNSVSGKFYEDKTTNERNVSIKISKFTKKKRSCLNGTNDVNNNIPKTIVINSKITYQKIIGWGGAFTDSTGINIKSLKKNLQGKLMRSYFSTEGLEYNLCRVPIGCTDFSTHGYTYVDDIDDGDYREDPLLTKFKLAREDHLYKIPLIKQAKKLQKNLLLFASAWTSPKWMKESGSYPGSMGYLKKKMYKPWANYFIKFLDNYFSNNITFWGITTGNEIFYSMAHLKIPGIVWTPEEMGHWISKYFGPKLRKSQHHQIKMLTIDDNRPTLTHSLDTIFSNTQNEGFIDGVAIHWYFDNENNSYILDDIHHKYPNKFLLYTEACNGADNNLVKLGSWKNAEAYAKNIIQVLNRWVTGWVDWNMVLDTKGGPSYIRNFVDSPIIVNCTAQEFYKQPMYYILGHFSKFIPRDSIRISSSQNDLLIHVAAFKRPDNGVAVVILNPSDVSQRRTLRDESKGEIQLELTPRSITTLLYW